MQLRILVLLAVVLASAFALGYLHPFGDPRAEPSHGLGTLLQHADMPPGAKHVLTAKCADCHSAETRWPIYARIAPGSWLIERDIVEARKHLDLSHWQTISPDQQQVLFAEIIQQARSGDMPPPQYLALHWHAKLSAEDVHALSQLGNNSPVSEATLTTPGDPVRGKLVFEKRCTGCHTLDTNREGPRLAGVYGRKAASIPGFNYSAGLKDSGITWKDATLERWLTDPDMVVTDTNMDFSIPKAQERRDIIAYLKLDDSSQK